MFISTYIGYEEVITDQLISTFDKYINYYIEPYID